MGLSYDQRSALRMAFEEAYVEPERRRACRVKQEVEAKLFPCIGRRRKGPIEVTIEDFSTTGVGLVHAGPLKVGSTYLLEVPRAGQSSIWVLLKVARCLPMDDGGWGVGLEAVEILDACRVEDVERRGFFEGATMTIVTKRTKVLFLLFGIVGTAVAVFLNF